MKNSAFQLNMRNIKTYKKKTKQVSASREKIVSDGDHTSNNKKKTEDDDKSKTRKKKVDLTNSEKSTSKF